jgi:hypothetical protein
MNERVPIESPFLTSDVIATGQEFALFKGWDRKLAEQLSSRSREIAIRTSWPKDAKLWFPTAVKAER